MSRPPLPDTAQEMLRRPNPAVMATLRQDGTPVTAATWYLWQDGQVLVNLDEGRIRLHHLRRDPRVSLTVLEENWYTHVTLIGRAVELSEDTDLSDIDRIAQHYVGGPYPERTRLRYTARIEIDRWHGWGQHKDSEQVG